MGQCTSAGLVCAELPGVLSLLPEGVQPDSQQTSTPLPYPELSARLANRSRIPLLVSNDRATMSLAGAQDKIGLRFDSKTRLLSDSVGQSPTTHILKPDTRQLRYQPSAINEYACMKLARALKLPVPDVWLLRVPEAAFLVARYDRLLTHDAVLGLHQIDGCQLLGHGPGWRCSSVTKKRLTPWASTHGRLCAKTVTLAFCPPWPNSVAWHWP